MSGGHSCAGAAVALLGLTAALAAAQSRPNVVLIISDDQGWGDFGFMGHEHIRTPALDRLAAQSAVFPNGYVTAPLCRPSLASMLTGRYPHQTGICGNDPPAGVPREAYRRLIRDTPTVPRLLAGAGYRCLQTGKWWEGSHADAGFTDGMTPDGQRHGGPGLTIGRQGLGPIEAFLDAVGEAPFFIWYAPMMPHEPHDPPERILATYRAEGRSERIARYWAMCTWFDETCGGLIDSLGRRGLLENTLILFIVDNGWIQAESEERSVVGGCAARSKRTPYEGGVRTPVLLSRPGRVPPSRREDLVSAVDLAPTILRACGLDVPAELTGADLEALACGRRQADREAVFGAVFGHDDLVAGDPAANLTHRWLRSGPWKLIVPAGPSEATELFDVAADPWETQDLAGARPEQVRRLRRLLDGWWNPRPTASTSTFPAGG